MASCASSRPASSRDKEGHNLDATAAGWGWYVDRTPRDDSEFRGRGGAAAKGRMDLLTVLTHEVGHLLGHDHESKGVMAESLLAGVRDLPDGLSPRWAVRLHR